MNLSRRVPLFLGLLGLGLLLALVFRVSIQENVVAPIALVFLLVWRLARSVDQQCYWGILIIGAVFYVILYRPTRQSADLAPGQPSNFKALSPNINHWRTSILLAHADLDRPSDLKRELGQLLAALYAMKQPGATQYEIYEALKLRRIPLPEHLYVFLFPSEHTKSRRNIKQVLHILRQTPRKWLHRLMGRDRDEYYQSMEEVITWMESIMEIKRDDE